MGSSRLLTGASLGPGLTVGGWGPLTTGDRGGRGTWSPPRQEEPGEGARTGGLTTVTTRLLTVGACLAGETEGERNLICLPEARLAWASRTLLQGLRRCRARGFLTR